MFITEYHLEDLKHKLFKELQKHLNHNAIITDEFDYPIESLTWRHPQFQNFNDICDCACYNLAKKGLKNTIYPTNNYKDFFDNIKEVIERTKNYLLDDVGEEGENIPYGATADEIYKEIILHKTKEKYLQTLKNECSELVQEYFITKLLRGRCESDEDDIKVLTDEQWEFYKEKASKIDFWDNSFADEVYPCEWHAIKKLWEIEKETLKMGNKEFLEKKDTTSQKLVNLDPASIVALAKEIIAQQKEKEILQQIQEERREFDEDLEQAREAKFSRLGI